MKVIFINGPAGSGKDTVWEVMRTEAPGKLIGQRVLRFISYKFAGSLKDAVHKLVGLNVPTSNFEGPGKDLPQPEFFGKTPRECYIAISEAMAKPLWGEQFFGKVAVQTLSQLDDNHVVFITDSGFAAEALPVIEAVGAENCLLLRLHRDGKDFTGDSRGYLILPIPSLDVDNNGDKNHLRSQVMAAIQDTFKIW